jgi:hypothetical protein
VQKCTFSLKEQPPLWSRDGGQFFSTSDLEVATEFGETHGTVSFTDEDYSDYFLMQSDEWLAGTRKVCFWRASSHLQHAPAACTAPTTCTYGMHHPRTHACIAPTACTARAAPSLTTMASKLGSLGGHGRRLRNMHGLHAHAHTSLPMHGLHAHVHTTLHISKLCVR